MSIWFDDIKRCCKPHGKTTHPEVAHASAMTACEKAMPTNISHWKFGRSSTQIYAKSCVGYM